MQGLERKPECLLPTTYVEWLYNVEWGWAGHEAQTDSYRAGQPFCQACKIKEISLQKSKITNLGMQYKKIVLKESFLAWKETL